VAAHQAEALILRTWPVQEADLIVSLLTREHGKLRAVAKAASRSRRRFGGALEPMTHVRAQYVTRPRAELVRLDSCEILSSPLSEAVDQPRLAALSFYAEVLDEMLPEGDPQDAIFRLAVALLPLTRPGTVWMPVTYFALWMTRLMGWLPELRRCEACRRPLVPTTSGAEPLPASWHPQRDGVFCPDHEPPASLRISTASLVTAQALLHAPATHFAEEPWPAQRAADLRRFALSSLERHAEQRLGSVRALVRLAR
jgi:DNA repair protein RecO (recombination protein O)